MIAENWGPGDPGQCLGIRLLVCCVMGDVSGSIPRSFSLDSLAAIRLVELTGLEK